jgi:hypothetical protein
MSVHAYSYPLILYTSFPLVHSGCLQNINIDQLNVLNTLHRFARLLTGNIRGFTPTFQRAILTRHSWQTCCRTPSELWDSRGYVLWLGLFLKQAVPISQH